MASREATDLATARASVLAWASRGRPKRGRGQPSRLKQRRSLIDDRLDSGDPLPIKVTGVPPHGLIPGQSLCDAFFEGGRGGGGR